MSSVGSFVKDAVAIRGSITPYVMRHVLLAGALATATCVVASVLEEMTGWKIGLAVAPFELASAALGLLLVLRTNAGYERWWEARKLWGGIVNQCRNLAISAVSYGPADRAWREAVVRWTAAFPYAARSSLRGQTPVPELERLLGADAAAVNAANHMPSAVAAGIARHLRRGRDMGLDQFTFLQIDKERAQLIDHIGACERILKTPLPRVYAIKVRRFIALFLVTLPLALLHRIDTTWLVPILTMLVAYPLIAVDRIAAELQNPFSTERIEHLPLDTIAATIEKNVLALLDEVPGGSTSPPS